MRRFAMSAAQTSYMMTFLGVGFAIGMTGIVQWLASRFSIQKIVVVNWLLSSAVVLLILLSPYKWAIWLLMTALGATLGLSYANIVSLFSSQVDEDRQGWVMGITGALGALGFAIVEFTSSVIMRNGYAIPLWIGMATLIIAAFWLLGWRPTRQKLA
jgi:predicted MFS family arabinose efflux permease